MKELAGKTVFVTGAASGIGLGIATAFAQAGAKVMLCDIEEAALSAALKQLRLTNVDVDGVKADVSLKAELALQLPFMELSESMGNHDSNIVDAGSVD